MVKANGKDMITLNYDPLCLELWEKNNFGAENTKNSVFEEEMHNYITFSHLEHAHTLFVSVLYICIIIHIQPTNLLPFPGTRML